MNSAFVLLVLLLPHAALDDLFETEVLPIFRQHCFECHGLGETEGELSLETVASLMRGGHTGSAMLSSDLEDSELYLRITSMSDGYRMPKRGETLDPLEIETIAKWIKQASGNVDVDLFAASEGSADATESVGLRSAAEIPFSTDLLEGKEPSQVAMLVISTVVILTLVCWMFYRVLFGGSKKREIKSHSDRVAATIAMLIGAMSCLVLIFTGYLYWRTGELVKENQSLRDRLQAGSMKMPETVVVNETNLPLPPHPMHPPRLGGQYYRGNDERSDSLFNGGFYRTATIDLHLVNSQGERVEWGDDGVDDFSVELEIRRAPEATKELFSQRVLDSISIQHFCQSVPGFKRNLTLEVVEKEDLWAVNVPLPKSGQWDGKEMQGLIYLMYGFQPGEARLPRPHFAIRYDLQFKNGEISDDSELWMGSMYTLGNRVLVPDDDKILLDRWFDWRPIPVIEGKGSSDPELLGTEEHVGK
ncbi:c-type cytochrome domain-containing protein [Mariniblastus fucicola]|uniref:c-type cytochrome domain-containing protein n=1 Tax=Mariniblastus fucicola TaxID=980251 RepID=UPI0012F8EB08|nr:c-type cytochrome domain-containing protein [Mariniblastus fucicola]